MRGSVESKAIVEKEKIIVDSGPTI